MRRDASTPHSEVASHEVPSLRGSAPLLLLIALLMQLGCAARNIDSRYAEVLEGPKRPRDVAQRIKRPGAECFERIQRIVAPAIVHRGALAPVFQEGYGDVLRSLHPVAKQVLRRTTGVWFAYGLPGAAARFVPCDADGGVGWVVVDLTFNALFDDSRDLEVPYKYWRLLEGDSEVFLAPSSLAASRPSHRAVRYVILHELGHAMSLLTGEFSLGSRDQFELDTWDGFSAFSWRARGPALHDGGGLVPSLLALTDWRRLRRTLNTSSTWLAPGYRTRGKLEMQRACAVVEALPRAGFVTPTAASSPLEDYAELFAHAILADEGKIHRDDAVRVDLPGCDGYMMRTPYAAPGVAAKRAYIESRLGLGPRP